MMTRVPMMMTGSEFKAAIRYCLQHFGKRWRTVKAPGYYYLNYPAGVWSTRCEWWVEWEMEPHDRKLAVFAFRNSQDALLFKLSFTHE